nr:Toll/interleukin-1 receptor (TIR) domain-containing protein [Tanacetum cinerariifolium]
MNKTGPYEFCGFCTDVLNDKGTIVSGVHEGKKMIEKKMRVRKVLIVLDDVDKIEQLEALVGDRNWFKPGSRIIITTRDEQVLVAHKVRLIRNVNLLSTEEAICLFSRYAFGKEVPAPGYEELSGLVASCAACLPLTIKVLGSFLCGKDDLDWKDVLERLETIPLNETMKVLELSYNGLEEDYKEIFLDVACIFKGRRKDDAVIALESYGFRARISLKVLEQKSLITISGQYGYLGMHDHIEEMGKNIVRRVNPNEPKRHSRLWNKEETEEILASDSATQVATKCIRRLDAQGLNFEILMKGLTTMKELRFLDVKMVKLWKDGEENPFPNLRFLEFTESYDLRTLDLSVAPNLETLYLRDCDNFEEVHFLVTPNLKELHIYRCKYLEKLHMPAESPKLGSLYLFRSKLKTLHLGITPNLDSIRPSHCTDMVELRMPAECPNSNLKLTILQLGITPNLKMAIVGESLSFPVIIKKTEVHLLEILGGSTQEP